MRFHASPNKQRKSFLLLNVRLSWSTDFCTWNLLERGTTVVTVTWFWSAWVSFTGSFGPLPWYQTRGKPICRRGKDTKLLVFLVSTAKAVFNAMSSHDSVCNNALNQCSYVTFKCKYLSWSLLIRSYWADALDLLDAFRTVRLTKTLLHANSAISF